MSRTYIHTYIHVRITYIHTYIRREAYLCNTSPSPGSLLMPFAEILAMLGNALASGRAINNRARQRSARARQATKQQVNSAIGSIPVGPFFFSRPRLGCGCCFFHELTGVCTYVHYSSQMARRGELGIRASSPSFRSPPAAFGPRGQGISASSVGMTRVGGGSKCKCTFLESRVQPGHCRPTAMWCDLVSAACFAFPSFFRDAAVAVSWAQSMQTMTLLLLLLLLSVGVLDSWRAPIIISHHSVLCNAQHALHTHQRPNMGTPSILPGEQSVASCAPSEPQHENVRVDIVSRARNKQNVRRSKVTALEKP